VALLSGSIGLIVAGLKLAGCWPLPSVLFPQSDFTRRHLPGRRPAPSAAVPGSVALGLLIVALLGAPSLMAISQRPDWVLGFVGTALVLAYVFGVAGWRERRGRWVAITSAALICVGGLGWMSLYYVGARQAERQAIAEAKRESIEYQLRRERNEAIQNSVRLHETITRLIVGVPALTGYDFEVWEKVPRGGEGEHRIRTDLRQFELKPEPFDPRGPRGAAYFLPASNRFYIQWDLPGTSTLHYYGPFEGDPVKVLGLASSGSAQFGPATERVINDLDEGQGNEALHLRTGTLSFIPADAQKVRKVLDAWLKTNHMDLLADFARNRWSLLSIGLTLADFPAARWDEATPADLTPALASGTTIERVERSGQVFYLLPEQAQWPLTFAFKTRESDQGLLQITGESASPRGVKIRYKLVSPSSNQTATAASVLQAKPGEFALTLTNGVAVEVVAVTRNPLEKKRWWKPDGTLLSQPPGGRIILYAAGMTKEKDLGENEHALLVRYNFPPAGQSARYQTRYTPGAEHLGTLEIQQDDRGTQVAEELKRLMRKIPDGAGGPKASSQIVGQADVVRFPAGTGEATLQCATASGPWEPVAVFDGKQTKVLLEGVQVLCTHLRREANGKCLDVTHNVDRELYAVRMMGVMKNGTQEELDLHPGVLRARETQGFVLVQGGQRVEEISEFVLERTPWVRGEIRGVALKPGLPLLKPDAVSAPRTSAPSVMVEAPPGQDRAQLKPGVDPEVFTLELDRVQMQDAVSLLREKYARRVCIEDLDFDLVKDRVSLKEALAQFEAEAGRRTLSSKEQRLLELARQWRREGKSEDAAFDMAQHYTGRFTAPSFDRLLDAVTQGTASAPYVWRRIGDTYVVYPRERSLLDYSVSLNTEGLTVEQAVQKILDQKPQGARIGRMQTYVGPARPGTDPMPWLKTKLPKLPVENVTAMEALCLVTERADPDLVWHIEGFQGQRHLSLLLSETAILNAKAEADGPKGDGASLERAPAGSKKESFGPAMERAAEAEEARMASRRMASLASLAAIPALLLIGLSGLVAGGLWIGFGVKSGAALGRGALVLALAGIWLGLLVGLALHLFNMRGGLFGYGLFLACEMGAFVLGWLARRETPGKAALIVAAVLMLGSLLLLS
jgi:hypothetical protein